MESRSWELQTKSTCCWFVSLTCTSRCSVLPLLLYAQKPKHTMSVLMAHKELIQNLKTSFHSRRQAARFVGIRRSCICRACVWCTHQRSALNCTAASVMVSWFLWVCVCVESGFSGSLTLPNCCRTLHRSRNSPPETHAMSHVPPHWTLPHGQTHARKRKFRCTIKERFLHTERPS